ncbi:MAG: hypothetical protein QG580_129 [Patescibacteria group bacterium]|jgi:hypothetical protein|nr:hypothetical protein [Patescibacteria group bacterium]
MNFRFWERPKALKSQEKIFEEAQVFVQNFKRNFEESNNLLNSMNPDPDQSVLDRIEAYIIDMQSNLSQIEDLMRQTKVGEDYFLIESKGERDSLEKAHQEIILTGTPFAEYSKLKIDLERFKKEALSKLAPSTFDQDIYQE